MANKLARDVESILSDALGEFIAQATLKKNCDLIGATPDNLTAAQLPELADRIERSVKFFSGDGNGKTVADKIRGSVCLSAFPVFVKRGPRAPLLFSTAVISRGINGRVLAGTRERREHGLERPAE